MNQRQRNHAIDYLKAIAAFLVVLHHAITYLDANQGSVIWQTILNLAVATHVPLFFVTAGYLCRPQPPKDYAAKKLQRIGVPFLTFSTLKLLYTGLISSEFAHGTGLAQQLKEAYLVGSLYWFPYAILLCFALAPLFWSLKDQQDPPCRSRLLNAVLVGLIALNLVVDFPSLTALSWFQIGSTLCYGCYFLIGMFLKNNQKKLQALLMKHPIPVYGGTVLLTAVLLWLLVVPGVPYGFFIKLPLSLSSMVLLLGLVRKLPGNLPWLKAMSRYSLQIMFFDSFYKVVLLAILPRFVSGNLPLILISVPVNLLLCCLSCRILERIPGVRRLFGL
jgi:surface polysaccharide O-acyltransferase-like enzyme